MRQAAWKWSLIAAVALCLPWTAAGQTCGIVTGGQELVNPDEITAQGGTLSTTLDVQLQTFCVPTTDNKNNTYTTTPMTLRTYMYPGRKTPLALGPGPTLRLRKDIGNTPGDSFKILLKNSLPYPDGEKCDSACNAGTTCDCSPTALQNLMKQCAATSSQACCCIVNCTQQMPNCFHESNVTNLHFHGSHVSPQSPQDYVLLDLYPPKPPTAPAVEHSSHGAFGEVVFGQFQYAIPSFPWNQPEGTHWYHPHKHGSASVQIANGMAGALLIEGPFDKELQQYYNPKTGEKILVIQTTVEEPPLFTSPGATAGQIMVNGQMVPTITVAPGEIQRWRFVNATSSSRTLLKLTLPNQLIYRQVAMDGVRFSPINYECQPLINFDPRKPPTSFPCNPNPTGNPQLLLAPGNRADFLVQMPLVETKKGTEGLRVERQLLNIANEEQGQRKMLLQRDEEMAPGAAEPALFTVKVDDGIEGNDDQPKMLKAGAPTLPTTLSPMPPYLRNITAQEVQGNSIPMSFQQFVAGTDKPWPYATSSLTQFKLSGPNNISVQFCPTCSNITTDLGKAYEWTITNQTTIPHPYHIHTNPFQLMSFNGVPLQPQGQTKPEPVWMDTLALPPATANPPKAPADPFTTPVTVTPAAFTMRQRNEDYTGLYVLHCHFLGHEDRGMMFAVQTVCAGPNISPESKGKYGRPTRDPKGECIFPPFPNPLPACTSATCRP